MQLERTYAQAIVVEQFDFTKNLTLVQKRTVAALEVAEKEALTACSNAAMVVVDLGTGRAEMAIRPAADEELSLFHGNERAGPRTLTDLEIKGCVCFGHTVFLVNEAIC